MFIKKSEFIHDLKYLFHNLDLFLIILFQYELK